jgi:transcription termination factor Rho
MPPVLDRDALAASPLADLHLIAAELGVDGFRRLRKPDLVEAIVVRQQGGEGQPERDPEGESEQPAPETPVDGDAAEGRARSRRGRRGGRGRGRARDADPGEASETEEEAEPAEVQRGGRSERDEERTVEGIVELVGNGSGFVRLTEGESSDEDVYVSAAQVKRCELVSGDRVAGPVRRPRRSERHPSLVRIETINGQPAEAVSEGKRYDDLPVRFPDERLALGREDPTVKAVEWLTPFGKGSRVVFTGPARSGKTEALRRVVSALAAQEGLEVSVVLAGVRPEETAEWQADGLPAPLAAHSFAVAPETLAQAVEGAVEQARRVAARGGDAVVVVDSLDLLAPQAARRVLAAARNLAEGGSLTLLATATVPLGGETTVVALNPALTALGRFPALDLEASGTLRPELLVGESGAEAIARARADALS